MLLHNVTSILLHLLKIYRTALLQYGKFLRWSSIGRIWHMKQMQFIKNVTLKYSTMAEVYSVIKI